MLGHRLAIGAGKGEGAVKRTLDVRAELLLQPPPRSQMARLDGPRSDADGLAGFFDT
jgi:hypothetical protein